MAGISEILDGALDLQINMEKTETMLTLSFDFKGQVMAPCDRCLDPVEVPLNFRESLIVKFASLTEEAENEDDMVWVIPENEYELDVFHLVYESIILALPSKIVHDDTESGDPGCNPEVMKQLEELSRKEDIEDPRWEALKKIELDKPDKN